MRKFVAAGVVGLAVLGVLAAAPAARAGGPSSFGLSIQTPGFGFSYGQGYPVYAPRPVFVPAPPVYGPPPVFVPAPPVYGPPVGIGVGVGWYGGGYGPYHHHRHGYYGPPVAVPYRGGWR